MNLRNFLKPKLGQLKPGDLCRINISDSSKYSDRSPYLVNQGKIVTLKTIEWIMDDVEWWETDLSPEYTIQHIHLVKV